jgi:hypothetical protein
VGPQKDRSVYPQANTAGNLKENSLEKLFFLIRQAKTIQTLEDFGKKGNMFLSDFRKSIAFWKAPRFRPFFLLVKTACR